MAIDMTTQRSRRALLAAAAGAAGAFAAQALGRPLPASAEGEAVVVGGEYLTAESVTRITNQTNDTGVFWASTSGAGRAITASSAGNHAVYASGGTGSAGVYALGLTAGPGSRAPAA